MKINLEKYCISFSSTIKEAIEKIEINEEGFILIINEKNVLLGIATDGDIRRHLIKKGILKDKIIECSNKNFISVDQKTSYEEIYKMLDDNIKLLPVLNSKNVLVNVITKKNIPEREQRDYYSRSKAPVRISFSGGGSDTTSYLKNNDGAVINTTISLYSHCTLKKRQDKKIIIDSFDLNQTSVFEDLNQMNSNSGKFKLINALLNTINLDHGIELFIKSDFPFSSGLGGSSAICASILGCFNEFRNDKWDKYEISELAYQAERLYLGIEGGWQDQYATVFGGFNLMEFKSKNNLVIPIRISKEKKLELEASLILCYTNSNHADLKIHQKQKNNLVNKVVLKNISKNVQLTYEIRDHLLKGEINKIGNSLNKSWELKKTFSNRISNDKLNIIYQKAILNGAKGGKLLGAGGGGFFLFFVDIANKNRLIEWILKEKMTYINVNFENEGMTSWSVRI
tara:strand:- start:60 stop:1424 length:1365 start_codon:yes stop_codon:yes gene_type:complete